MSLVDNKVLQFVDKIRFSIRDETIPPRITKAIRMFKKESNLLYIDKDIESLRAIVKSQTHPDKLEYAILLNSDGNFFYGTQNLYPCGGLTDITKAVRYGQSLIKNPKKAIMVIISDFYEGRGYDQLTKALKQVLEGQTKILGIAALGYNSKPMYDRAYAKKINQMGIDVIACTPKNLPELIAKLMK